MPLQAAPLISKTSAVETVFMLLIWICCSSSVGGSNIYYEQCLKKTGEKSGLLPDVTVQDMFLLLAAILQMDISHLFI